MNNQKLIIRFLQSALCLILVFAINGYSQRNESVYAVGGSKGIFINLSDKIDPANKEAVTYIISRTNGNGKKIVIAETKQAKTKTDFIGGLNKFSSILPNSPAPTEADAEKIWNRIIESGNIDSVALWGAYPVVRLALGLMIYDSIAEENTEYVYFIEEKISGESISEATNPVTFPGTTDFSEIKIADYKSGSEFVSIEWKTSLENIPSNFLLYRQDNGKGEFKSIDAEKGFNTSDVQTSLYALDNSVEANNFYKYYLIPLDLFENQGNASDTIFVGAYNFNTIPAIQNLSAASVDTLGGILLSWKIPSPGGAVSLRIFKSEIFDSAFVKIADLSPDQNSFLDVMVKPMKRYYYYLQLIGPLAEESPTSARIGSFYMSSEVPIPPVNVHAEGLQNGVKLSWENSESFIDGFYIYRSNGLNDTLLLISDLIPEEKPITIFNDTSAGLSGKLTYFYSIKSMTSSHIESIFSDTISIRPLIPTEPPAPTNLSGYIENNEAIISWDDMNEKDESILGYVILRREKDENGNYINEYQIITDSILYFNNNSFVDEDLEKNKNYEYAVLSIDMFGGQSALSNSLEINFIAERPLPPAGLKVFSIKEEIKLKWEASLQEDIVEYRVYRQIRNASPEFLGTIKAHERLEITDRGIEKNELYFYYVTAVNKFDVESSPSGEVFIRL